MNLTHDKQRHRQGRPSASQCWTILVALYLSGAGSSTYRLIVGDVHQKPLSEIWAGTEITDLIERHERGDYPDVCRRCTYFVSVYNSRKSRTFGSDLAGNWAED